MQRFIPNTWKQEEVEMINKVIEVDGPGRLTVKDLPQHE